MLVILFVLLIIICIVIISSNNNIFHPYKSYPYFLFIYVVPYTLLYLVKGESILSDLSYINIGMNMYDLMCWFILLTIISLLFFILGAYCGNQKKTNNKELSSGNSLIYISHLKKYTLFFFTMGIILFFYYYHSIGGISYYIENLSRRSTLTSGSGYISSIFRFMLYFSSCLCIIGLKYKKINKKLFLIILSLSILMLLVSGSRSIVLRYFFILSTVSYFIYRPTVKSLLSGKNLFLGIIFITVISFYVVITPIIRSSTINGSINLKESFYDSQKELESLAKGNSYTEIQLNILHLFDKDNFWLGQTYLDLLKIPIPRSVMPNKPSGDDGIYIYNSIANDRVVSPGSIKNLIIQSWPPYTFGISYANFGVLGICTLFYILGFLISKVYRKMLFNMAYIYVFFYAYVFWRLQLSNLSLVEVLTILILLILISILFPRIRKIRLQ